MRTPRVTFTASVIGGGVGGQLSLRALADSEHWDLKAACDLRPEVCQALREQFPTLQTFLDYREMLEACPTDLVCVSTYPTSHEPVALDALRYPLKGILVEKPLGHTLASGRRILEAVKRKGLPMVVPHGLLAKKAPLEIIDRVRNGDIGELKLVEIQHRWDLMNAGIHWLSFFVALIDGAPLDYVMAICDAQTRTYRDGLQVETIAVTYAQTKNGVRLVVNTGEGGTINREGKTALFRLVGTLGHIEFWGWENAYIILNTQFPTGKTIVPQEFPVTMHRRYLDNLAAMIEHGTHDYAIPEGSLKALEICEGAYLSNRYRCQVTFPIDRFTPPSPPDWDPGTPYSGAGGGRDGRALL
jgi:predicted dehydrogenase